MLIKIFSNEHNKKALVLTSAFSFQQYQSLMIITLESLIAPVQLWVAS